MPDAMAIAITIAIFSSLIIFLYIKFARKRLEIEMFKHTNFISNSFKFITIIMLITWLIMPLIPLVFFPFLKVGFFLFLLPKYWSLNA